MARLGGDRLRAHGAPHRRKDAPRRGKATPAERLSPGRADSNRCFDSVDVRDVMRVNAGLRAENMRLRAALEDAQAMLARNEGRI